MSSRVNFTLPQCLEILSAFNSDRAFAVNVLFGNVVRLGSSEDGEGFMVTRVLKNPPRGSGFDCPGPYYSGTTVVDKVQYAQDPDWFLILADPGEGDPNVAGHLGDGHWTGEATVGCVDRLYELFLRLYPRRRGLNAMDMSFWLAKTLAALSVPVYGKIPELNVADLVDSIDPRYKAPKKPVLRVQPDSELLA
jgi:hypothetical protein